MSRVFHPEGNIQPRTIGKGVALFKGIANLALPPVLISM